MGKLLKISEVIDVDLESLEDLAMYRVQGKSLI